MHLTYLIKDRICENKSYNKFVDTYLAPDGILIARNILQILIKLRERDLNFKHTVLNAVITA